MKKNLLLFNLTLVISLMTACQVYPRSTKTIQVTQVVSPAQIIQSSIMIVIESIQATDVVKGYGIGTLVLYRRESFLVTHNHWGDLLQDKNVVEFRDADNRLIMELYGSEFKGLIRYQDAGTLILSTPEGLAEFLIPARLDYISKLVPGTKVQIIYRQQPNRDKLLVLDAIIEETREFEGESIYILRSLNGQPLYPGDSGGGVWYNGMPIANTWAVQTALVMGISGEVDHLPKALTDLSYAAIFPEDF